MIEYHRSGEEPFREVKVNELLEVEVLSDYEGIYRVAKVRDSETLAVFNVNGFMVSEPDFDDPEARARLVYRDEINSEGLLRGHFRFVSDGSKTGVSVSD